MKKEEIKILLIEKSDIIRKGLSVLLIEKNNTPLSIEQYNGDGDLLHYIHHASPKILIASPSFFDQNKKQISALKEKYQLLLVGLIYAFQDPDSLSSLDALIYINDRAEKVQATINELLKSYPTMNTHSSNEPLSSREKEILKLLVNGNTTKQIATALHISPHTVNAHRKNIMRKLDIKTVSGLTIYAVLNNIITLKEA